MSAAYGLVMGKIRATFAESAVRFTLFIYMAPLLEEEVWSKVGMKTSWVD
jgi:hypothetical protein